MGFGVEVTVLCECKVPRSALALPSRIAWIVAAVSCAIWSEFCAALLRVQSSSCQHVVALAG